MGVLPSGRACSQRLGDSQSAMDQLDAGDANTDMAREANSNLLGSG